MTSDLLSKPSYLEDLVALLAALDSLKLEAELAWLRKRLDEA